LAADVSAGSERLPIPPSTAKASSGVRMRVLVVDDNHDAALAMGMVLERLGCSIQIAYDGPSALRAAADLRPDLALLDIGLPEMDGYEVARRMRAVGTSARLIALTGYGQESDRVRSFEAGFDEHIVKPIGMDGLAEILARCVSMQRNP
jgi:CheY-like chemotaxis protein